jgi:type IV secretory pathway VirB4 component
MSKPKPITVNMPSKTACYKRELILPEGLSPDQLTEMIKKEGRCVVYWGTETQAKQVEVFFASEETKTAIEECKARIALEQAQAQEAKDLIDGLPLMAGQLKEAMSEIALLKAQLKKEK